MADRETQPVAYREIASAFVTARRNASRLDTFPGRIPETLADAYQIQDAAIALADLPIGGWKVGRIIPPHEQHYGSDRLTGPIFTATIVHGESPAMPVFADGFGAAEAEFLLRIGTTPDPAKARYSLDEAAALISAVHIGIEIASSPLAEINDLGPAVTVSDFGNNHGLLIGCAIQDWQSSGYAGWPVTVAIDGVEVGNGTADAMPDGPIGAARFLFELMAARGIALSPGQWISTGAITGVHPVVPGSRVEARFGEGGTVCCTIEAERKR